MMRIHREGRKPLFIALIVLSAIYLAINSLVDIDWLVNGVLIFCLGLYVFMVNFFRNPERHLHADPNHVVAPADGKVVAIEEVEETEYFKDKRIQISIFMSPLNVHVNRYPIGGRIIYAKYHPGAFLVAWHPKSSFLNERTTVVVEGEKTGPILYKQIAGALARRIIMYAKEGLIVKQGADSGFIRFGSRVDVILPLNARIKVKVGDKPKGNETVLAEFLDN
jgi:phosphatidylserine decarboxylase